MLQKIVLVGARSLDGVMNFLRRTLLFLIRPGKVKITNLL